MGYSNSILHPIWMFIRYILSKVRNPRFIVLLTSSTVGGGPKNPNQSTAAFRIPWAVQIFPAGILFIGLFWFPTSPRWLATKDRSEDAIKVLALLHGKGDVQHPKVLAEWKEIQEQLAE